jgi:peptide/nickel transport system substrate-binding protein
MFKKLEFNLTMKILIKCLFIYSLKTWSLVASSQEYINVAISSSPNNLNPLSSSDSSSQNINRLVHRSLIELDEKLNPICDLCESFQELHQELKKGGKYSIKFILKKNIKFWNNEEVSAHSIKQALEYYQSDDKKFNSIFRQSFLNIEKIIIHNNYQFELIYKNYSIDYLSDLNLLKIIKISNTQNEKIELQDIVGCGDYTIKSLKPNEITIHPLSHISHLLPLKFKVVSDETTLALKILKKEIDISLANLSPRKFFWLEKQNASLKFFQQESSSYQYIAFNFKKPLMADLNVRKAIKLILPIEDLINLKLRGTVKIASSFMSPLLGDFNLESEKQDVVKNTLSDRVIAANKLLDQAGLNLVNGARFTIDWIVPNNKQSMELVNTFKFYLDKINIKVNIHTQEWGTYLKSLKDGRFDIFMGSWIGFLNPGIMRLALHQDMCSPYGRNRGCYQNSEFSKLVDKALETNEKIKRDKIFLQALEIVNRELPYIHLWHPNTQVITQGCIELDVNYPNGNFLILKTARKNC